MTGSVGILNVGAGDTKLTFDPNNPAETIRAARVVKDMIRRGYALLIEIGRDEKGQPLYRRALDFDEATAEYIIADFDPTATTEEETEHANIQVQPSPASSPKGRRQKVGKVRVPAEATNAVAVARTAGG